MYCKDLKKIINDLIYVNKERRLGEVYKVYGNILEPQQRAKEFCTVTLNLGRQIGYTTYIKNNSDSKDEVIYKYNGNNHQLGPNYIKIDRLGNDNRRLYGSVRQSIRYIDTVYVDTASAMSPKEIDSIYDHYARMYDFQYMPTFVLLG